MLTNRLENAQPESSLFLPVFLSLKKPPLVEVARLLERRLRMSSSDEEMLARHKRGFDSKPDLWRVLNWLDWSAGPDKADLVAATWQDLRLKNDRQIAGRIREGAYALGLKDCPDWVIPAIILHLESLEGEVPEKHMAFNLCLAGDNERREGVAMFYQRDWHIYCRGADPGYTWVGCPHMRWVFWQPKLREVS